MHSIDVNNLSNKELRLFSIIFPLFIILVEGLIFGSWIGICGKVSFLLPIIGLPFPKLMKWPYRGFTYFGAGMGFVMVRILLCATYFFIFTPISFFFRLSGRDILKLKKKNLDSYWEDYDNHDKTIERYRRLF